MENESIYKLYSERLSTLEVELSEIKTESTVDHYKQGYLRGCIAEIKMLLSILDIKN